jgi:hypothetical protein
VVRGGRKVAAHAKIHRSFFRLDRFPSAAERGTANAGGGERLSMGIDRQFQRLGRELLWRE